MPTKSFTNGRLRKAEYDTSTKQLELHFDGGNVLAYTHVPEEVWRRLCAAPNAATYWEDRIAEEYPKGKPAKKEGGGKKWEDLFGGDAPDGSSSE